MRQSKIVKGHNLNSPIKRNLLASVFGVGVNLLNQIVLVPFYIVYWGNDLYSDWIVISALMTIFSLSDVGLNNVFQNRFAIKFTEGEHEECNSLLNSNIAIISLTLSMMLFLSIIYLLLFDIVENAGLHVLTRKEAGLIFIFLMFKVFLSMYSGVLNSIYRANHHADKAIFYDQITFLIVVVLTFIFVVCRSSLIWLSCVICLPYIASILFKYFDSRRYFKHQLSIFHYDWHLIRQIILPSLSFMSFPVGNTMILQGFTLVVNKFFGADEVVLFNTTRTLCNFMKTLVSTVQSSVWPEYSIAYGKSDYGRMRVLHRKTIKISLLFTSLMGLILLTVGPMVYEQWTRGRVEYDFILMVGFIVALIIESIWVSSSVTVMATNNHTRLGVFFMFSSVLALGLAIIILKNIPQLHLIAIPLILMQLTMTVVAIREGLKLTKDHFSF